MVLQSNSALTDNVAMTTAIKARPSVSKVEKISVSGNYLLLMIQYTAELYISPEFLITPIKQEWKPLKYSKRDETLARSKLKKCSGCEIKGIGVFNWKAWWRFPQYQLLRETISFSAAKKQKV